MESSSIYMPAREKYPPKEMMPVRPAPKKEYPRRPTRPMKPMRPMPRPPRQRPTAPMVQPKIEIYIFKYHFHYEKMMGYEDKCMRHRRSPRHYHKYYQMYKHHKKKMNYYYQKCYACNYHPSDSCSSHFASHSFSESSCSASSPSHYVEPYKDSGCKCGGKCGGACSGKCGRWQK